MMKDSFMTNTDRAVIAKACKSGAKERAHRD
jgi:hypothetical protein